MAMEVRSKRLKSLRLAAVARFKQSLARSCCMHHVTIEDCGCANFHFVDH